jgi:hypothetical protein
VELVLLVIAALFLLYLVGARPWPLQECPRCKGKGRYTHTTSSGPRVAKDCTYCNGGWMEATVTLVRRDELTGRRREVVLRNLGGVMPTGKSGHG